MTTVSDDQAAAAREFLEELAERSGCRPNELLDGRWYMELQAMLEEGCRVLRVAPNEGHLTVAERLFHALAPTLFSDCEPDGVTKIVALLRGLQESGWIFVPPPGS